MGHGSDSVSADQVTCVVALGPTPCSAVDDGECVAITTNEINCSRPPATWICVTFNFNVLIQRIGVVYRILGKFPYSQEWDVLVWLPPESNKIKSRMAGLH